MLNPLMLFGLAGLALPVVIHLIQRQRVRPRQLATMRFLEKTDTANAFRLVPRDVLQLLLRLLLLSLFILAMARFTAPADRPSPRRLVVVLDNSMSMQRMLPSGETLFEKHRARAAELFDGLSERDAACFMLVGDEIFVDTGVTTDRDALAAAVTAAEPSDGGGRRLPDAVLAALGRVDGRSAIDTAVLVFTDLQESAWRESRRAGEIRRRLAEGRTPLVFVSEPLPGIKNTRVVRAAFHPESVHLGIGSALYAVLEGAKETRTAVEAELTVGASAGESRPVELAPDETVHVSLVHSFEAPVDTACSVSVTDDSLAADNVFRTPMRIRSRRQVLLVTRPELASEDAAGLDGPDLLSYALNPEEALGLPEGVHTSVRRIPPDAFGRMALSLYAAVVLYGVDAPPTPDALDDLSAYARNGGGVWFIPDREVDPVRFNESFAPLLGGLRLGAPQTPESVEFLDIGEAGLDGDLLLPLLRGEWGEPEQITFAAFFDLEASTGWSRLLQNREDAVLCASCTLGEGRIFLQTFSCALRDTSLPRTTAFLPFARTTLDFVCGGMEDLAPDVIRAGETTLLQLPRYAGLGGEIVLDGPETRRVPLTETGRDVPVGGLYRAGVYEISHPAKKTGRTRLLCVNPAEDESDPAVLGDDAFDSLFGYERVRRLPPEDVDGIFTAQGEILPWLTALVFAALIAEALAAAWQSRRVEEADDDA